jgi:hypothetical protein
VVNGETLEQAVEQTLEQAAEIEEQDQERRDETESPSLLSSQDIGTGGYPPKKVPFRNHSCASLYLWEFNFIVHERRKYLQLHFVQII